MVSGKTVCGQGLLGGASTAATVLLLLLLLPQQAHPDSVQLLPDNAGRGRKVQLRLQLNTTPFGLVEVMDFEQDDAPTIKFMRSGRSIVGADFVDVAFQGQSAFRNFGILQTVAFKRRKKGGAGRPPPPLRVLQLGLGAGTVPSHLRAHGVLVDVVEINRDIVEAAAQHFGYNRDPSSKLGTTHIEDALAFLQRWVRRDILAQPRYCSVAPASFPTHTLSLSLSLSSPLLITSPPSRPIRPAPLPGGGGLRRAPASSDHRYDAVIHDLFVGHNPLLLLERGVIKSIKDKWLNDDGVLLVDFFGYQHAGTGAGAPNEHGHALSVAVQATLEDVFGPPPTVRCFRELDAALYPDKPSNLIFAAWAGKPPAAGAPPFAVPDDPEFPDAIEGSVHWVQQHFHEFEITQQLRTGSPGFPADAVIGPDRAARSRVDDRFLEDYRDLLASFFPPATDWFPSEADRTAAAAAAAATAALAEEHAAELSAAQDAVTSLTDQLRIAKEEVTALLARSGDSPHDAHVPTAGTLEGAAGTANRAPEAHRNEL